MRAAPSEIIHQLREHPFLKGLDPSFLEALEEGVRERHFDTGDTVVREGDPARELLLVIHGKLALELVAPDHPRLSLLTVGPGEIVGWSWLLPPHLWQVDARALKPTRVIAVDGEHLKRVLEERPKDAYQFLLRLLPVLNRRLEIARTQVMDIHGP